MPTRSAVTHRGCTLSYDVSAAPPHAVPVLLIHGTAVGGAAWGPQVEALAPRHRCVTFDNRGYGRSQPLGEPLTLELMAEDALAVLDAAGLESAHVAGHSLGGLVALYLAHQARPRVRSLALLNTFASGAVPTALSPWVMWLGLRTHVGTRRMRRRAFLEMILAPGERAGADLDALADRFSALFDRDLGDPAPVEMKQVRAMARADATPFLAGLAGLPALVVSAEHDRLAPPSAGRALAAGLPGARHVELAGCSHAVPIHRAAEVNAHLLAHLDAAEQQWKRR